MSVTTIRRVIGASIIITSLYAVETSLAEYRVVDGSGNEHKVLVFGQGKRVDKGDPSKLSQDKSQALCALVMEGKEPTNIPATKSSGERELLREALKQIVPEPGWEYSVQSDIENVQVTWRNPRKKSWPRVLDKILCDNTLSGVVDWDNKIIEVIYAAK